MIEPSQFVYFIGNDLEYYGELFIVYSVTSFSNSNGDRREVIVAKKNNDNSVHGFVYSVEIDWLEYFGDFDDTDSAYPEMRDWLTVDGNWSRD